MPSGHKRVLLVDDSRVVVAMLKRMIADTEFQVVGEAQRGTEAIEKFKELEPDLVILDIVMPDMDGVQILGEILGLKPETRVVMASSLGTKEKVMECIEKGARSFITKPYSKDDLLSTLRNVFE